MNSTLIIGCGGAGIGAMGEAVRLLACRRGGLERVACLAVDGDRGALDGVSSWGRRKRKDGHDGLLVRTVRIEEGVRLTKVEEECGEHPLDKVWSLDIWTEPVIRERMQLAEREDGTSVFGAESGTPGEGYVSPLYVRNERMSGCRWKPWMQESGEAEG